MNKRGQIYLVAVILIGFILFALLSQGNYVRRVIIDDDFDTLSKNFDTESARFINENLDEADISVKFADFSKTFSEYSRTQNPDFELLFLLRNTDTTVYFCNLMENSIEVSTQSTTDTCSESSGCYIVNGCYQDTTSGDASRDDLSFSQPVTTCESHSDQEYCKVLTITGNTITIEVDGVVYRVDVPPVNKAELIVLTKEDKGEQRRVFMEKGFVHGKGRDKPTNNPPPEGTQTTG